MLPILNPSISNFPCIKPGLVLWLLQWSGKHTGKASVGSFAGSGTFGNTSKKRLYYFWTSLDLCLPLSLFMLIQGVYGLLPEMNLAWTCDTALDSEDELWYPLPSIRSSAGDTRCPEHCRDAQGGKEQKLLTQGAPGCSPLAEGQSHTRICGAQPSAAVGLQAGDARGTGSAGTEVALPRPTQGTKCFWQAGGHELLPSLHHSMGLSTCRAWSLCLVNSQVPINLFLQVIEVLLSSSCALQSISLVSSARLRSFSIPPCRGLVKLLNWPQHRLPKTITA